MRIAYCVVPELAEGLRIASCSRFNATLKDDISIALGERLALSAAYGMIIAAGRMVYLSTYEYFFRTKAVTITPPRLHRFLLVIPESSSLPFDKLRAPLHRPEMSFGE